MTLPEQIAQIEELHTRGTLTAGEFAAAKSKLLAAEDETQAARHQRSALARLDLGWQNERRQYMVSGRNGVLSMPNETLSLLSGLFLGGIGLWWLFGEHSTAYYPLYGLISLLAGMRVALTGYLKAESYRKAERRYQEKRARLLAESNEA